MIWNFKGIFKDWEFDHYYIINNEFKHSIWVANGFGCFKDDSGRSRNNQPFLGGFSFIEQWLIWNEYKNEMKQRVLKNFNRKKEEKIKNVYNKLALKIGELK